jgi:hypothetical protein
MVRLDCICWFSAIHTELKDWLARSYDVLGLMCPSRATCDVGIKF